MDTVTRGNISKLLANYFEDSSVLENLKWLMQEDEQINSEKDFALGFLWGMVMSQSNSMLLLSQINKKIPEEANQEVSIRSKPVRLPKIPPKDFEELKSMAIPWIASYRKKIDNEELLKRVKDR